MDWEFKENAEMQGSSDGFWYDIALGGYIDQEAVLSNSEQIKLVKDAVKTLLSFEHALEANELLTEF